MDLSLAAFTALRSRDCDHLQTLERLDVVEDFERLARTIPGINHQLINQLGEQRAAEELQIANLAVLLSQRLHITESAARRRIKDAAALGPGTTLGGQPLPGEHSQTGEAQRSGDINADHADVILKFFARLPSEVSAEDREMAESQLVDLAKQTHPGDVEAAARQIEAHLDPDGTLDDDKDTVGKTYLRVRPQGRDKLTRGTFCIDAETYSYLEPWLTKFARPGMCNPADEKPLFDVVNLGKPQKSKSTAPDETAHNGLAAQGLFDFFQDQGPNPAATDSDPAQPATAGFGPEPAAPASPDELSVAAARDSRNKGQRQHDALKFLLRSAMGCPDLGQHRGLPVTAVITMSLKELEAATGYAMSGGGALIPMRQAIRMAAHAHHYLLIYDDDGRPLYLGRGKRLASPDQRLALYASDRGCTFPGCAKPGYFCQAHHIDEWAADGQTDIDRLTFACSEHHALIGSGDNHWATTVCGHDSPFPNRTLWHPPGCIDPQRRGKINHYHQPGEYLMPTASFPGLARRTPSTGGTGPGRVRDRYDQPKRE